MKKILLRTLLVVISIAILASFSFAGCKVAEEETAEEVVKEEVEEETEEAEEEAITPEEKITIVYANWTSVEEATKEPYIELMKGFEELYPNVTIENLPIPWIEVMDYYVTSSAGGNPPDVFQTGFDWPYELGAMGALADQSELDPGYIDELIPGSYVEMDGKIYSTPQSLVTMDLWANKSLMAKAGISTAPTTIDEFTLALKKAKEVLGNEGVYPFVINTMDPSMVMEFMFLIWSFGADPLKEGVNFDTPEMKSFLEWIRELASEELMAKGIDTIAVRELASQEKAVFAVDHNYFSSILQSLNPELDFNETFTVLVPPITDKASSPKLPGLGGAHAISTQCNNKNVAMEFVKYMNSSDGATKFVQDLGLLSGTTSQNDPDKYPDYFASPIVKEFLSNSMPYLTSMPYSVKYGSASEFIFQAFQKVIYTDEPIEDILLDTETALKILYGE